MRTERIDEDIKFYLDKILRENMSKFTDNGIITITSVKATKDLKYAKVYVSIFGTKYTHQVFEKITRASGYIRKNLASMLKARNIPDLLFELDDSMEYGEKMDKLISNLDISKQEENKEE